jgi:hypothetical protein
MAWDGVIRHNPKKGPSLGGYRQGCRCTGCRKLKRDDNASYRAEKKRKDAQEALAGLLPEADLAQDDGGRLDVDWSMPPGPIEAALAADLAEMKLADPPFEKALIVLAKYDARVLDQIPRIQRLELISGMQSRLFNVFDRLRRVNAPVNAADGAEAFLRSLSDAGDE